MKVDWLIVGSGLTGSVIARTLSDAGRKVLVVERRSDVGGNVHDYVHESGIRIHSYGPHYFRTSSKRIWEFVNRFASFEKYEAVLKSYVDGKYENWPVVASYIEREIGNSWEPGFKAKPTNFEEASLAKMAVLIYEKFVKGYTEKQWGVPARSLNFGLANRFDVRENNDLRLVQHKYQGIPKEGYRSFMKNMLNGVPVILNFDYLKNRDVIHNRHGLVFTGPIDEFFAYDLGRLAYRGQKRVHKYYPDKRYIQPCAQVNNPDRNNGPHIRTIEWKHIMPKEFAERIKGTVLTMELPFSPTDPNEYEYPFPDSTNAQLYRRYRVRANSITGVLICGRLGEYRYYDMDQAIGRAMKLANSLIEQ